MEKQTWFLQVLPLKEMALRKLVALIWTERDILELIKEIPFYRPHYEQRWRQDTIEDRVKEKISNLVVPESLKRQMKLIVKPIGVEIVKWEKFMCRFMCFSEAEEILDVHLLEQLYWTSAGTIDYKKTAERIVGLQTLDVVKRFEIACVHCLVDALPLVWKELPEVYKKSYSKAALNRNLKKILNNREVQFESRCKMLRIYWAFVLKGQENELLERYGGFYHYACMFSAEKGYKSAVEFFFRKLTIKDRSFYSSSEFWEENILNDKFMLPMQILIKDEDVIIYLFQQMTLERQMHIFRKYPGYIYRIFLLWPTQDLFWDKIDLFWFLVSERNSYKHLLIHVDLKMYDLDWFFPGMFLEFFCRSPEAFRKCFVNQECLENSLVLRVILSGMDKETALVILRNIDHQDRVRLVSCCSIFNSLTCLLVFGEQNFLKLIVREFFPSKQDRERLKEIYMVFAVQCRRSELEKITWRRLLESLDESDANGLPKRSLDSETVAKTKRLRLRREKVL